MFYGYLHYIDTERSEGCASLRLWVVTVHVPYSVDAGRWGLVKLVQSKIAWGGCQDRQGCQEPLKVDTDARHNSLYFRTLPGPHKMVGNGTKCSNARKIAWESQKVLVSSQVVKYLVKPHVRHGECLRNTPYRLNGFLLEHRHSLSRRRTPFIYLFHHTLFVYEYEASRQIRYYRLLTAIDIYASTPLHICCRYYVYRNEACYRQIWNSCLFQRKRSQYIASYHYCASYLCALSLSTYQSYGPLFECFHKR